jgi:UV DNA damage endonuclease
MRLGFAVKILGEGGLATSDHRRAASGPHLRHSLELLGVALDYLDRNQIRMYRFSSSIAPYATHPAMPDLHDQVEECAEQLGAFGARCRDLVVRLSSHPGQYTVLNSETQRTRDAAAADVELQARLLDAMGCGPEAVCVLHIGGAAGGREAAITRFERGLETLSERAVARLVVENDDRSFSLGDALEVSRRTGLRVVWDILHHHCHDPDGIPDREALELAIATWPDGVVPKIHYSSPKTALEQRAVRKGRRVERSWVLPQLRAHADMIDPIGFEHFVTETARGLEMDVMLEAKGKDLALLRLRDQLAARGLSL